MKYTNVKFAALASELSKALLNGTVAGLVAVSDATTAGDGSTATFAWTQSIATADSVPLGSRIKKGTVSVTDGTETFTDNGDGTLTGDAGGSGTVNYETFAISVTFNANVTNSQAITVAYSAGLAVAAIESSRVAAGNMAGNHLSVILQDIDETSNHLGRMTINFDGVPNANQFSSPLSTAKPYIGGVN